MPNSTIKGEPASKFYFRVLDHSSFRKILWLTGIFSHLLEMKRLLVKDILSCKKEFENTDSLNMWNIVRNILSPEKLKCVLNAV